MGFLDFIAKVVGSRNEREIKRIQPLVARINTFEAGLRALSDAELRGKTEQFRTQLAAWAQHRALDLQTLNKEQANEALFGLLPEAFAVVREAGRRVLNMRHYDVQLIGGMVLHEGKISEMRTGEGKTLVATLPLYLNALLGRGAHLVTVNDYLAKRDAEWMGQIYRALGMSVGVIVHDKNEHERQAAYRSDITYGQNNEFGFDYLRDNMKFTLASYAQRELFYAIVDEVDSILIDEARTPLIISGPTEQRTEKYQVVDGVIPVLRREVDYTVDEKARSVMLTEAGIHKVEAQLGVGNLYEAENVQFVHHVGQALRAHIMFKRDVDYVVQEGEVKIVDEFTGRIMDGRRWSNGLHQAIEAKEGVQIQSENQTLATITFQNYFRMYVKLGGMTGTAQTEAAELGHIYKLDVLGIPTHKNAVREDLHDLIYLTEQEKFEAIVKDIAERHGRGQPVLVGTASVERSEVLSRFLQQSSIPHNVLNAKYHRQEAAIIAQAGRKGAVTIATNMAGRGTDILLGGNAEFLAKTEVPDLAELPSEMSEESRLAAMAAHEERRAAAIEKYRAQCSAEQQEVKALGGLHIIGTERHESRRIDNQLRGRAGRQGDPGSSRFYLSLDDDLIRIFGGDRMKNMMLRFGMKPGEVIEHSWVTRSIEGAQRRVEAHNFDIRKNLLEYDDVMNEQRKNIYGMRRAILGGDDAFIQSQIKSLIEHVVATWVERYCPPKESVDKWQIAELEKRLQATFMLPFSVVKQVHDLTHASVAREAFKAVLALYDEKEKQALAQAINLHSFERELYLQGIDHHWKEHLLHVDHLKEGIHLRGYAQKDPKQEYRREAFRYFGVMIEQLYQSVMETYFHVNLTRESEEEYLQRIERERAGQYIIESHAESSEAAETAAQLPPQPAKTTAHQTPEESAEAVMKHMKRLMQKEQKAKPFAPYKRDQPKIGRNDPCHCGSGKKYKNCHLQADETPPKSEA